MITTPSDLKAYKSDLKRALQNQFLGTTLDNFATAFKASRSKAFEGIDLDALIAEIAAGKDAAIPYLEELFAAFKARAEAAGIRVHVAHTAFEANSIISDIARANQVKKIVKGKSMTAEETFLNDHLEKDGFVVTETDLGEWIIQLRHEGPSHMVMPAIHLSRKEVAELFTKVTGQVQDPNDINGMVKVARRELRQVFLDADMGITGANFAIAETGTIGLVTNEGNGRLVTTLPRVHVALVGFDKLVPDLKSALRILKALPRNATGQLISTYVTWITGPTECTSAPDGRKVLHIVFLDNGRLALARDPLFSQALRCIRCGACANVCPIYKLVGGHNYGHVYIGAIGLILTYFYHGRENARAIIKACLNCQACKAVCPTGIDLPYLIKGVYRTILEVEGKPPNKKPAAEARAWKSQAFPFPPAPGLPRPKAPCQRAVSAPPALLFFQGTWVPQLAGRGQDPTKGHVGADQSPFGESPLPGGPLRGVPGGFCLSGTGSGPGASPQRSQRAAGIPHGTDLLRFARHDDG